MADQIDMLNAWLYNAGDDDLIFFFYPPEGAITKKDLLTRLRPAPLPVPPPPTEPPPIPVETLVVNSAVGLSIRAAPAVTAAKRGVLANGDTVEVQGATPGGEYTWALLLRVNGLKYADVGYVSRQFLAPK